MISFSRFFIRPSRHSGRTRGVTAGCRRCREITAGCRRRRGVTAGCRRRRKVTACYCCRRPSGAACGGPSAAAAVLRQEAMPLLIMAAWPGIYFCLASAIILWSVQPFCIIVQVFCIYIKNFTVKMPHCQCQNFVIFVNSGGFG